MYGSASDQHDYSMKKFTRGAIKDFLARYASDAHVLDIGAGGDDHRALFPNRVTLDIDPARRPDVVADAQHLPFPEGSFDGIVCSEVLEHIEDPKMAIAEMRRVLKPGGFLVLTTRFAFPIHDAPGDYWRFTPYGLKRLFEGWTVIETASEARPFGTIAVLLQRIGFQTKLRGGKITKAGVYGLAFILWSLDWLVMRQYGDIRRDELVDNILSSGVYIACRKA